MTSSSQVSMRSANLSFVRNGSIVMIGAGPQALLSHIKGELNAAPVRGKKFRSQATVR